MRVVITLEELYLQLLYPFVIGPGEGLLTFWVNDVNFALICITDLLECYRCVLTQVLNEHVWQFGVFLFNYDVHLMFVKLSVYPHEPFLPIINNWL